MKAHWKNVPKGKKSRPFLELLRNIDPDVQCERKFPWLFVPKASQRLTVEHHISAALKDHCRQFRYKWRRKSECNPDRLLEDGTITSGLEFDFYLPARNIAVEFDERQHFTEERSVTLNFRHGYAFEDRWLSLCSDKIIDPTPITRDWVRAFRDAVRDVRAKESGVKLVRVYFKDWSLMRCQEVDALERLEFELAV